MELYGRNRYENYHTHINSQKLYTLGVCHCAKLNYGNNAAKAACAVTFIIVIITQAKRVL